MPEIVQRLLSTDPYWWPTIGALLVLLGLLMRRLRGRQIDWELEGVEVGMIVVLTFVAFAVEAFGEPYEWDAAALMVMAFAAVFTFAAVVLRLGAARLFQECEGSAQEWNWTSLVCSVAAFCLTTGKAIHTWLLLDQPDDAFAINRAVNGFGTTAAVVGLMAIVMIAFEAGTGIKYRWQHRGPAVPHNVM
jgi:hypothetical protein